jgi:transcriptional regulator with XRE-family HTH domain
MLGKIIKALRAEKGITQEELGKILGVTTSMVGMLETSARRPSYEVLTKISDYFNVTTDYLLGQSPFRTYLEEIHSIAISSIKYILDELELGDFIVSVASEKLHILKEAYTEETIQYINGLLERIITNQSKLTDLEYLDLMSFISNGYRWSGKYKGPVIFIIGEREIACDIDYHSIPRIAIDESSSRINIKEHIGDFELKSDTTLPILDNINDVNNMFTKEQIAGTLSIPNYCVGDFIIKAPDNSLCGLGLFKGDLLICQKTEDFHPGQIIIAHSPNYRSNSIIIRLYTENDNEGSSLLKSAHPDYQHIKFDNSFIIIGIVTSLIRLNLDRHQIYHDFMDSIQPYVVDGWADVIDFAFQKGLTAYQLKELMNIHIRLAKNEFQP